MIDEWMKRLLDKYSVKDISEIPKESLRQEAEDVKGTISNETIWRDGSEDEQYKMHQENIDELTEYLELINKAIYKDTDREFEDFLIRRNDEICEKADMMIRACEGLGKYEHDMFFTAMVIDHAESIMPEGTQICYPGYDGEFDTGTPCYRCGNCEDACIFISKDIPETDTLVDMLSLGKLEKKVSEDLNEKLKEYVSEKVAPLVKEVLDGEI